MLKGRAAPPRTGIQSRTRRYPLLATVSLLVACEVNDSNARFAVSQSAGVTIVTEAPDPSRLHNATLDYGDFFVRNGCLQVRTDTSVFTPALPAGSSVSSDRTAIIVAGREIRMGQRHSLPSASEVGPEPDQVAASIGLPSNCAQRLLRMGAPV